MLATDDLLFVHLHKSGGTFINELLLNSGRNARRLGYHLPYRAAPAEVRHLPVLGTIRDPFAYYVSWFHFQRGMRQPNALFVICSDKGRLDFAATVRNLLLLGEDTGRLDLLENAMPEKFGQRGLNLTKACVRDLRGRSTGFYTFLTERMYRGAPKLTLLQTERIRTDLPRMAVNLGTWNKRMELFLRHAPPLNVGSHAEPATYYDADLRSLVSRRDARAFAMHAEAR